MSKRIYKEGIDVSDTIDDYNVLHDHRKAVRAKYGIECPECKRLLPKANATILEPQQWCKRRGHIYQDPRPELTNEQWSEA